jgi:hypothetical protein
MAAAGAPKLHVGRASGNPKAGHSSALAALLSPALVGVLRAQALLLHALLLPRRALITSLYLTSTASGDLLAWLTGQPTSKMQARGGDRGRGGRRGAARRGAARRGAARDAGARSARTGPPRPPTPPPLPSPGPPAHPHRRSWSGSARRCPRRSTGCRRRSG